LGGSHVAASVRKPAAAVLAPQSYPGDCCILAAKKVPVPEEVSSPALGRKSSDVPRNLKPYFLCFLIKGERWDDPAGAENLMPAQLAFLREQIEWRRYKTAGPVTDGGDIVGFSILEAADAEAALALASQDPAVAAGRVSPRILPVLLPALDMLKVDFPSRA
jgi:uncharacterized protein YciI